MEKPTDPIREQAKQDASDVRKNYTRAANMLIYGYRNLSPQEKWLYFCLIHLCGPRGTRYLSLRFISEQTGISVGALSSSKDKNGKVNEGMVRHLHDAGLIHSEIKKRDGRGNAQYHITITDVWALNQAFFIERNQTRSDFGQDENETTEPVRISDVPVQNSDKLVQISDKLVRNSDEPVRNPVQIQDYSKTTNKITDKTGKQEGTYSAGEQNSTSQSGADAQPAPDVSLSFVEAREYLTALGYKLEPTPQAYECEEPGKALWSVSEPNAHHLFDTLTTTEIKRLAQRIKARTAPENDAWQAYQQVRPQIAPVCQALASNTPPAKSEQDSVTPELSTSLPPSGKAARAVTQPPSSQQNKTNKASSAAPAKPARAQLTLLGGQVRTDYETIRACRLRMTEKNINALNTLGELDGMDFVNLKETIELIETQSMVKERNIPIDPQALASEDGYWRFDKWYPVVLRNRQKQVSKGNTPPPPTSASLPSYSHMTDDEYYAMLSKKGNQNVRTTHAR